jgi:N-acetylmuramoyl-L-alanine amidase
MKCRYKALLLAGAVVLLAGCAETPTGTVAPTMEPTVTQVLQEIVTSTPTSVPTATNIPTQTPTPTPSPSPTNTPTPSPTPTNTPTPTPSPTPTDAPLLVVIDPGHQRKGNYDKEPNGPGSTEMKAKVSSGTQGVSTGIPEYELTLAVSLLLKEELTARGYEVIMTRETHDIDISNVERAVIANEANAAAFIRVHADSSDSASAKGVMTICQTPKNPYNAEWYEESYRFSKLVLDEVVASTGAKKRRVWETDTMTGINWTTVPTTILEMGFMSNPEEDELMATQEYREKIAMGVANAIDRYLKSEE